MIKTIKRHALFLSLALGALVLSACSGQAASVPPAESVVGKKIAVDGGFYTNVNVAEMQTMLKDKDFTFVNVHIPFAGNIPGTDLSIPFNEIEANLDQLPADRDAKIVVYCRSGSMSAIAAQTLVKSGYTNVWNLDGGMVAWERAGLPIEKTP